MRQQKQLMRTELKKQLASLEHDEIQRQSAQLAQYLIKQTFWQSAEVIGLTIARKGEVATRSLIETAWQQGKRVAVPRVNRETKQMHFYQITDFTQVESTFMGLKEPNTTICSKFDKSEIDTLVVPGLAFDNQGYRLGYGGGYYDRFLEDYEGVTVALALSTQLITSIPKEGHDLPVRFVITPEGVI